MKTDELIALLAADPATPPRARAAPALGAAIAAGVVLAALFMLAAFGVRPDWRDAIGQPMFWLKLLLPAGVAVAGFVTLTRLARPGGRGGAGALAMAAPIAALWIAAAIVYAQAAPAERAALAWGTTWRGCVISIALISAPVFAAVFIALRRLAPTRLRAAGACAGALAGAAGAAVYAVHCPETGLPFMALWYVAGMAVPAALGALAGPRGLRW